MAAANSIKRDCFMIDNAEIAVVAVGREGAYKRANLRHQMRKGKQTVIAIRIYENGGGPPDSQGFQKITLEIDPPHQMLGQKQTLRVLKSYYSDGSSSDVANGFYSWADNPFQQLVLYNAKEGDRVELQSEVIAKRESVLDKGRTKAVPVSLDCPITKISVSELTPWIGKLGTTPGSFFNRE
jgi:hypothetical protein